MNTSTRLRPCRHPMAVVLVVATFVLSALEVGHAREFLRGDTNGDGIVSLADMVQLERSLFGNGGLPPCLEAADVNDDGSVNIVDSVDLVNMMFSSDALENAGEATTPAVPFPDPGLDPNEPETLGCSTYEVSPPLQTDDAIRLGDVDARPGDVIEIPIFIRASVPVSGVQLVVEYDPGVLQVASGRESMVYDGSWYERWFGQSFTIIYGDGRGKSSFLYPDDEPGFSRLSSFPDDGFLTLGIVGNISFPDEFEIDPSSEDVLVGKIRALVSGDVPAGTKLTVTPRDGPDGEGYGAFSLRNELTHEGESRLATILPSKLPGVLNIGVDGDISFFLRGDADDNAKVDITDAIRILGFLFAGAEEPVCHDAADANDSGSVDLVDAVAVLDFLFGAGESLPAPYPLEGSDPNPDFLPVCRRGSN